MSKEAIEHYEAALKEAFPLGASGDVFHHWNEARKALAEQPAQGCDYCNHPLYAGTKCKNCGREQPAQSSKPWVGLTDEEIDQCLRVSDGSMGRLLSTIEAKLKEKNT